MTVQVLALIFPDKVWSGLIAATENSSLRQAEKEHGTAGCALRFWQAWLVRRRLVGKQFWAGKMFTNVVEKIGSPGDIAPVQDLQVPRP